MDNRQKTIEAIKITLNDFIEHLDDIVPNTDGLNGINVQIHIPSIAGAEIAPQTKMYIDMGLSRKAMDDFADMFYRG